MFQFISKKILVGLASLFGVLTMVFVLFNLLPGDPAQMMLGQNQNEEQLALVRKKYGFDRPLVEQYFLFLNDVSPISIHSTTSVDYSFFDGKYRGITILIGNYQLALKQPYLRESFQKTGKGVDEVIGETFPNTLVLAIVAMVFAIIIGCLLGVFSAINKGNIWDNIIQFVSTIGVSVPSFFSAIIIAWLFGFVWYKYTGLNMSGNLYELDDFGEGSVLQLKNLILPALVLGIRPLAVVSQLIRNSLLEVFDQEYIRTARAKGLNEFQVVWRHALKNALNPVVTAVSGWFASMLAGAVFVEYIFGWNGIGKELVNALNVSDLPIVMGIVLLIALVFIVINIFVDILYLLLDPKIKSLQGNR